MKKYILIFLFLIQLNNINAQETFFKFLSGWRSLKIIETESNYIACGLGVINDSNIYPDFTKMSFTGDSIDYWGFELDTCSSIGIYNINNFINNHNNLYFSGTIKGAESGNLYGLLCKFQIETNDVLWSKYYITGNVGCNIMTSLIVDNSKIINGIYTKNNSNLYSTLLETDTSGNIRWQKDFYCGNNCNMKPFHILPTVDNGFLFTCFEDHRGSHYGNNEFLKTAVIKTDSLGNTQWRHTWGGDSTKNEGSWVVPLDDGNFLFAWTDNDFNGEAAQSNYFSSIYFIKFDINGNVIWEKTMLGTLPTTGDPEIATRVYYYAISQMELMPDGNIIVAGNNAIDGFLLKIDQEANYIWHRELMPPGLAYEDNTASQQYMRIKGVTFTSDNGFILAGEYFCAPGGNLLPDGLQSAFVYKLDEYGCYEQNCHVGIEETKEEKAEPAITIYPNPSNGILNLNFTSEGATQSHTQIKRISVFNTIGQQVYNKEISLRTDNYQINLNHFPKGLYFIDIDGVIKKKFILE